MQEKKNPWKWRIIIGVIVLFIGGIIFAFTPWGGKMVKDTVIDGFKTLNSQEEYDNSALADRWIFMCYWRGFICTSYREGIGMYQDFFGIVPTDKGRFIDVWWGNKTRPWSGMFFKEEKGEFSGWGILHIRGPEAFESYCDLYGKVESKQFVRDEGILYWVLFHEIYKSRAKGADGKPHINFYKHWTRVETLYINASRSGKKPGTVMKRPEGYPEPLEIQTGVEDKNKDKDKEKK